MNKNSIRGQNEFWILVILGVPIGENIEIFILKLVSLAPMDKYVELVWKKNVKALIQLKRSCIKIDERKKTTTTEDGDLIRGSVRGSKRIKRSWIFMKRKEMN